MQQGLFKLGDMYSMEPKQKKLMKIVQSMGANLGQEGSCVSN